MEEDNKEQIFQPCQLKYYPSSKLKIFTIGRKGEAPICKLD
jgi:hypothetical protein